MPLKMESHGAISWPFLFRPETLDLEDPSLFPMSKHQLSSPALLHHFDPKLANKAQ